MERLRNDAETAAQTACDFLRGFAAGALEPPAAAPLDQSVYLGPSDFGKPL